MKLYSFTTVRNEEDIIESFVRYNLNILDGMVISDNCSTDNTLNILKELKKEGLNIDILIDENKRFDQTIRRNELLNYTIDKYKPDFVFPIDADEFICSNDGKNPRKIIEKLDKNYLYNYEMKNYVIDGTEKDDLFIPKMITKQRIIEKIHGYDCKCFISSKMYKHTGGIYLVMGSHTIQFNNKEEVPTKKNDDIFLAHYPVRNKYQVMNKVITGRLNNSSLHSREEGFGFHQYVILDEIIENGTLSDRSLYDISKYYSVKDEDKNKKISLIEKGIDLSFCKNIKMKYTKKASNKDVLSNTLIISEGIINHMRDELKGYKDNQDEIIFKYNDTKGRYKILEESYNSILNSISWKITKPIRTITNILKRKKK